MRRWLDLPATLMMLALMGWQAVRRPMRRALLGMGLLAGVVLLLACTRLPFDAHRWLGTAAGECNAAPDLIVVLGGSGMPSGPELRRLQEAATLADRWPGAAVLVVHPGDPAVLDAMAAELRLRGVSPDRIQLLNEGDNTRAQALAVEQRVGRKYTSIALVTAPENTYRSVRSFREVGWTSVCGAPAWDHAMFHEFDYVHEAIGGRGWTPDVSGAPGLRYTWWNYLKLEVTVLREWVAIVYYWINGWV
jgi:uncharacterized SAM-binding protein YcdF (DUF218 family)